MRMAPSTTECDAVGMGWGLKPEAQLADLADIPFDFDPLQHNWVPRRDLAGRTPVPGVYLAGDGAGIGGAEVAELAGARAALALLEDAGHAGDAAHRAHLDRALRRQARFRAALERTFPFPAALAAAMADDTILCRCEAITAGELRAAAAEPATGPAPEVNRAKAFTRIGMGRCQGRVCGPAGGGGAGGRHSAAARRRSGGCAASRRSSRSRCRPGSLLDLVRILLKPDVSATRDGRRHACPNRARLPGSGARIHADHETSGRRPRPRHAGGGAHRPGGDARCAGAVGFPPANLDPHQLYDVPMMGYALNTYDGLYRYENNPPELLPWLARATPPPPTGWTGNFACAAASNSTTAPR